MYGIPDYTRTAVFPSTLLVSILGFLTFCWATPPTVPPAPRHCVYISVCTLSRPVVVVPGVRGGVRGVRGMGWHRGMGPGMSLHRAPTVVLHRPLYPTVVLHWPLYPTVVHCSATVSPTVVHCSATVSPLLYTRSTGRPQLYTRSTGRPQLYPRRHPPWLPL